MERDAPALFLVFRDHAIPVAAAGSGVEWLVHLGLGLALPPGCLALVEEPEVFLHPAAIQQAARAIWTAIRSGVQVVLTTHSLELIDALVSEPETDEELDLMAVYRLALRDGILLSSRAPGKEVSFLRATIDEDLR
jgi:AAA15 family ATPase/GTPase